KRDANGVYNASGRRQRCREHARGRDNRPSPAALADERGCELSLDLDGRWQAGWAPLDCPGYL
ncbi:MAG: hypothetical protein ACRDK2_14040, partial [Solirubrobacteraceae bacterium]